MNGFIFTFGRIPLDKLMRLILLLILLVCFSQAGFGQVADLAGEKKTISSSLGLPSLKLLWLLRPLSQFTTFDDSLTRHFYARNRVKSVTLLRLIPGIAPDTVEHTELDRAGYATLTLVPAFRQHAYRRYNRKHQLISFTSETKQGVVQTVFDPATLTTTTRVGPTLAKLALYQTGHATQHGKNSEYEAFLLTVPGQTPLPVSRILERSTVVNGDTIRLDLLGYRDEQVVSAESYYAIGQGLRQREGGIVVLPTPGRPHRSLEGHYIPNTRSTFNAAGWPTSMQSLPTPPELADKPVTRTSADGYSSVTTSSPTDTATTTYLRNAHGQLLREERRSTYVLPSNAPPNSKLAGPFITVYDYLPNGLCRSKTDNQGIRYEYHYTFH
jgi:hypothetical protein